MNRGITKVLKNEMLIYISFSAKAAGSQKQGAAISSILQRDAYWTMMHFSIFAKMTAQRTIPVT